MLHERILWSSREFPVDDMGDTNYTVRYWTRGSYPLLGAGFLQVDKQRSPLPRLTVNRESVSTNCDGKRETTGQLQNIAEYSRDRSVIARRGAFGAQVGWPQNGASQTRMVPVNPC
jgi:hypothetical protein